MGVGSMLLLHFAKGSSTQNGRIVDGGRLNHQPFGYDLERKFPQAFV